MSCWASALSGTRETALDAVTRVQLSSGRSEGIAALPQLAAGGPLVVQFARHWLAHSAACRRKRPLDQSSIPLTTRHA